MQSFIWNDNYHKKTGDSEKVMQVIQTLSIDPGMEASSHPRFVFVGLVGAADTP